ncbi:MAG: oligosaccharide flippase family protein [Gallionella sp.]|nr:oligosaccharide flippase family protein [Gallionella sp.]
MNMGRNLLAGLANSIWSALIGFAVVPFYLKYLGIEAYGLIGFFVTTQAVLSLLDMGMAPTINREVARCSASGELKEAGKLLHTLAVVYWCMAGAISLLILVLAPFIAEYWLQSKQLSVQTISHAMMLMGVVVACRWPIGLYQGAIIGAQRLTVSSGINMTMVTIGSAGAVAILAFISPTIEAFFIWQACVGLTYAIAMRFSAWRIIGKAKQNRFEIEKLKSVWRFTAGMSGIGLTALVFTQMDKVILSKMLGLEKFGHYMLATVVVSGLYVLITPVYNVIYPRFSALVATGETEKLAELYRMGTRLLVSVIFPIAMVLAVFGSELVQMWTGNLVIASSVAPVIAFLAIGSAMHGAMYFPYALQLAYGMTRLPLAINIILMIAFVPLIIYFAQAYGAIGGALAWLVLHVLYMLLGTWLTHRYLLKGVGIIWLLQDIGMPLMLTLLMGVVGYFAVHRTEYSVLVKLICGSMLALVAIALSIATSRQLCAVIQENLNGIKDAA